MVGFDVLKSGMCQAIVTDTTEILPIYLLFEQNKIEDIEAKLKMIPYKEPLTLDFFKMIVAGCIRNCLRY
jgi:hypothetical protein